MFCKSPRIFAPIALLFIPFVYVNESTCNNTRSIAYVSRSIRKSILDSWSSIQSANYSRRGWISQLSVQKTRSELCARRCVLPPSVITILGCVYTRCPRISRLGVITRGFWAHAYPSERIEFYLESFKNWWLNIISRLHLSRSILRFIVTVQDNFLRGKRKAGKIVFCACRTVPESEKIIIEHRWIGVEAIAFQRYG